MWFINAMNEYYKKHQDPIRLTGILPHNVKSQEKTILCEKGESPHQVYINWRIKAGDKPPHVNYSSRQKPKKDWIKLWEY